MKRVTIVIFCVLMAISGCSGKRTPRPDRTGIYEPVDFADLPKWREDQHLEAFKVFRTSCEKILSRRGNVRISRSTELGSHYNDWEPLCREAVIEDIDTSLQARAFFEKWFKPYQVLTKEGKTTGKYTGYYEIMMNGSRKKTAKYKYPIYRKPRNLEEIKGSPKLCHKAINSGSLAGKKLEIAYTDNQARHFFMQIQGSGIIKLDNGKCIKLAYDGQNGYPYKAIGTEFKKFKTGKIESALDMINWLHKNPKPGRQIMETNESYVFFREVQGDSPIGAQGIPLVGSRSIAIDRYFYPYGTPVWIDTDLNRTKSYPQIRFTRMMIAQDTGGAIRGPIRGDIFFGRGQKAEERASYTNNMGTMYVLFPREAYIPRVYKTNNN